MSGKCPINQSDTHYYRDEKWVKDYSGDFSGDYITPFSFTTDWSPVQVISFYSEEKLLGTIDYSGPELTFSGNADATARALFDSLIVCNSTYIKGLLSEIESLKQKK